MFQLQSRRGQTTVHILCSPQGRYTYSTYLESMLKNFYRLELSGFCSTHFIPNRIFTQPEVAIVNFILH